MPTAHSHTLIHEPKINTAELLEREWLLTNGGGGFAMGTAIAANTRRYHGLLIAAVNPPVGRVVVLNNVWEQLELQADQMTQRIEFNTNLFRDPESDLGTSYIPASPPMLRRFDRGLDVVWSYQWGKLTFTRRLVLHDGQPAATLHYDLTGLDAVCASAKLRLSPMITLRDFHHTTTRDDSAFACEPNTDRLTVSRDQLAATYHSPNSSYDHDPDWWYRLHYPIEARRGAGDGEDLFVPGHFKIDLGSAADAQASFTATLGHKAAAPSLDTDTRDKRLEPIRVKLASDLKHEDEADLLAEVLAQAADDFIVERTVGEQKLKTIIAGYPWFADWGRDTFIALPGLMLATGRTDQARDTLQTFAAAIQNGLVPNRFDDADPTLAHYNTIDASMWFLHAALNYMDQTGDASAWDGWLAQACISICQAYAEGTEAMGHDGRVVTIRMDDDGLITGGSDHSQLTWMDAATPDHHGNYHVFTPRPGKCIEINGLWYSALARLSTRLGKTHENQAAQYKKLTATIKKSFTTAFWDDSLGYFIDHIAPADTAQPGPDRSLRPNQFIACALEHSPIQNEHRKAAVQVGMARLLTPVGPRTLPTDDPAFFPAYRGDRFERDRAYHRGPVWPWLIGPLGEAVLRADAFSPDAKQQVRDMLQPLVERLITTEHPGCIGQLHEIHEPVEPFAPRGTPAQAWSVSETLRLLTLLGTK